MEVKSDYGKAFIFNKEAQLKARLKRLQSTIYNFGTGVDEQLQGSAVPWLFSLTYRNVDDWDANHIRTLINRIRAHLRRRNIQLIYAWVAELQKRGAVHYHIVIWLPKGFQLPKLGRKGWWPHGFTDQKIARKSVGYLMKYISKDEQKHKYPKGIRIYGVGGCDEIVKRKIRYYRCSLRIRKNLEEEGLTFKDVDLRKVKGGVECRLTNRFFKSNWLCFMAGKVPCFFKVDDDDDLPHLMLDFINFLDYNRIELDKRDLYMHIIDLIELSDLSDADKAYLEFTYYLDCEDLDYKNMNEADRENFIECIDKICGWEF